MSLFTPLPEDQDLQASVKEELLEYGNQSDIKDLEKQILQIGNSLLLGRPESFLMIKDGNKVEYSISKVKSTYTPMNKAV